MKRYFMLFMLCATIMLVGCQNGASGSAGGSQAAPTQAAVQPVSEMEKPVPSDGKTISFEKRRGMVDLLNKAGDKKAVRVILGKRVRSVHPEDYGEKSPDIGMNYRPAAAGFPRLEEFAVSPDNAAYFAADGALYAKMGDGASGLTAVPMAKKGVLNIAEGTAFIEMRF